MPASSSELHRRNINSSELVTLHEAMNERVTSSTTTVAMAVRLRQRDQR